MGAAAVERVRVRVRGEVGGKTEGTIARAA